MHHLRTDNLTISKHAADREQQRSIPALLIDSLLEFGECRDAGNGAESHYFGRRGWRDFQAYLGAQSKHFERYRNIYVIIAGGVVITVAHRH